MDLLTYAVSKHLTDGNDLWRFVYEEKDLPQELVRQAFQEVLQTYTHEAAHQLTHHPKAYLADYIPITLHPNGENIRVSGYIDDRAMDILSGVHGMDKTQVVQQTIDKMTQTIHPNRQARILDIQFQVEKQIDTFKQAVNQTHHRVQQLNLIDEPATYTPNRKVASEKVTDKVTESPEIEEVTEKATEKVELPEIKEVASEKVTELPEEIDLPEIEDAPEEIDFPEIEDVPTEIAHLAEDIVLEDEPKEMDPLHRISHEIDKAQRQDQEVDASLRQIFDDEVSEDVKGEPKEVSEKVEEKPKAVSEQVEEKPKGVSEKVAEKPKAVSEAEAEEKRVHGVTVRAWNNFIDQIFEQRLNEDFESLKDLPMAML